MAKKNLLLAGSRHDAKLMAIAFDLDLDKWELGSLAAAGHDQRFDRVVVQIPSRLSATTVDLLQQAKALLKPGAAGGLHLI